MKKRLLIFAICLIFSIFLSSCSISLDGLFGNKPEEPECTEHRDKDDDGRCDKCDTEYNDGEEIPEADPPKIDTPEIDTPEIEADGKKYHASATLYKGTNVDFYDRLKDVLDMDTAVGMSACEGIATVNNGKIIAVGYGKTTVSIKDSKENSCDITVIVKPYVNTSGYDIKTVEDETVYKVQDEKEANALIDLAIMKHIKELTLDFSSFGSGYVAYRDFEFSYELNNHVGITKKYYESKPEVLYVEFTYKSDSASTFTEETADNSHIQIMNANMFLKNKASEKSENKRADDFSDFDIYKNNSGTMAVYNSEELWWALEHNYLPTFPTKYTKAEAFFEEAKMILREIITEDMDDYDKALAIFEYLVHAVEYDYDAYDNANSENANIDVCYYLEGVFERSRAVCDGKSKAFVMLCKIEGIDCVRDFGQGIGGGIGHAWNYVRIGGVWYLVDTTAADSAQAATSVMGEFFGENIEFTTYENFLSPLSDNADRYIYSNIFEEISTLPDNDRSADFLKSVPEGLEYDFHINSEDEFKALLKDILMSEELDTCIISISLADGIRWNLVVDDVIEACDSKALYSAFTDYIDRTEICYIVFKNI